MNDEIYGEFDAVQGFFNGMVFGIYAHDYGTWLKAYPWSCTIAEYYDELLAEEDMDAAYAAMVNEEQQA